MSDGSEVAVTVDKALIGFNNATPQSTYKASNKSFKYDVPVYYNGAALTDKDGKPVTVTAYIGVKGDTDLDNVANASDASLVLKYYAEIQTGAAPESTKLIANNNDANLENLSAFLSDVDKDEYDADNWKTDKTTANNNNGKRAVDASDASSILSFYAEQQVNVDRAAYDIWKQIFPDKVKK